VSCGLFNSVLRCSVVFCGVLRFSGIPFIRDPTTIRDPAFNRSFTVVRRQCGRDFSLKIGLHYNHSIQSRIFPFDTNLAYHGSARPHENCCVKFSVKKDNAIILGPVSPPPALRGLWGQ